MLKEDITTKTIELFSDDLLLLPDLPAEIRNFLKLGGLARFLLNKADFGSLPVEHIINVLQTANELDVFIYNLLNSLYGKSYRK